MGTRKTAITKSHCNRCGRETNHRILASRDFSESFEIEGYGPSYSTTTYQFLECAGCESVSMRQIDFFEPTDGTDVILYPPVVARRKPDWLSSLPQDVKLLVTQTYTALDANSRALAVMGARAVVDMVLVEQIGDVGGFEKKLEAAEKGGVISAKNREVLSAALDAGNAAAHRGHQPSTADVNAVMDIVENMLQAVYHLGPLATRLRKSTPNRKE